MSEATELKKKAFVRSPETELLVKRLGCLSVGEFVSYEEISLLVGRTIDGSATAQARHILFKEKNIFLECVTGSGIRRGDDVSRIIGADGKLLRSRRAAKRTRSLCASVEEFEKLSKEKQTQHNMLMSQAGLIEVATSNSFEKKVGVLLENTKSAIPPLKMLEAFKDS